MARVASMGPASENAGYGVCTLCSCTAVGEASMGPASENAGYVGRGSARRCCDSSRFNGSGVRERRLWTNARQATAGGTAGASMGPTSENAGYAETRGDLHEVG